MIGDHLDKEISVSAELTESGVTAKAKSRTLAAIDRLLGSVLDSWSAPLEIKSAELREQSAAKIEVIRKIGEMAAKRLDNDPESADQLLDYLITSSVRKHENKRLVLRETIEDLRRDAPTADEANSGTEVLEEEFLSRFERYAEDATEEGLRVKWGKVLAAEIRNPGSISRKAMRIVDEISPIVAYEFENFCQNRIGNVIPKCLSGELTFNQKTKFVEYELISDPGLTGQVRIFGEARDNEGEDLWICNYEFALIAYRKGITFNNHGKRDTPPLIEHEKGPGTPVYILTDVGYQIASIFNIKAEENWDRFLSVLADLIAPNEVRDYRKSPNGNLQLRSRIQRPEAATSSASATPSANP